MKKMHLKIISQSKIINYCSNFQYVQFDHFAFNFHLLIAVSYLIYDLDAEKERKGDFSKLFDSVRGLGVVCIVFQLISRQKSVLSQKKARTEMTKKSFLKSGNKKNRRKLRSLLFTYYCLFLLRLCHKLRYNYQVHNGLSQNNYLLTKHFACVTS